MNVYKFARSLLARRSDLQVIVEEPCDQPMGIEVIAVDTHWGKYVFDHCSQQELKVVLEAFMGFVVENDTVLLAQPRVITSEWTSILFGTPRVIFRHDFESRKFFQQPQLSYDSSRRAPLHLRTDEIVCKINK
jgi:hypothetical protein